MKKFNVTIENEHNSHRFSFEATDIKSAIERLSQLKLNCVQITELPDNFQGTIRNLEEMYK